jgi:Fe-S-cluster containining protein
MEDFCKSTQVSSQVGNPRQWLAAYFKTRAHLASCESAFHCDPACTRPGCKNQDLQVPVNLVDLLGAALHRGYAVSEHYQRHYSLGLLSEARDAWLRLVSLRLKKPCPFLENELCSIYPVRPLPCVLFPEYLAHEGTFAANAEKPHFRDYLCFRHPLRLSPERARVIAQLKRMWERENLVSNFYLFGHGSCHLDFSNLVQELLLMAKSSKDSKLEESPERIIPNPVLERFFLEHIAGCQPFSGISKKILHLNNPEGQEQFLRLLQDDRLVKKLRHNRDDRALVYRFAQGKLQTKRRSLTPREYKFYG